MTHYSYQTVTNQIKIFGEAEDRTVQQLKNCLSVEEGSLGVLCADNHVGYSQPIGGAVAYREHISPTGVGYDIGCGNKAVRTNVMTSDLRQGDTLNRLMDEIFRRVSFGVGQSNDEEVKDHPVFDSIKNADFRPQSKMLGKARNQLGTVGAGNHYVDLFEDEVGMAWIGVHFGSRGFGHRTCTGFLALAQGLPFSEKERKEQGLKIAEGEMDSPPVVFHQDSGLGQSYIRAMELAGEYAYAGRDVVCNKVLEILGAEETYSVHNHHNFAWRESHAGENFWVVRKGCTPAYPGQEGFVGATMGEESVILEGVDTSDSEDAFYSTVHGAGRAMSRTHAAGRTKKRWSCNNRDCDWVQQPRTHKPEDGNCPKCGNTRLSKRWVQEAKGEVDWDAEKRSLDTNGIILRGGAADEAPPAYKRLTDVLAAQGDTISITHRLRPIGVAMAGADTHDPYKD